jgi:hypothetical protein
MPGNTTGCHVAPFGKHPRGPPHQVCPQQRKMSKGSPGQRMMASLHVQHDTTSSASCSHQDRPGASTCRKEVHSCYCVKSIFYSFCIFSWYTTIFLVGATDPMFLMSFFGDLYPRSAHSRGGTSKDARGSVDSILTGFVGSLEKRIQSGNYIFFWQGPAR